MRNAHPGLQVSIELPPPRSPGAFGSEPEDVRHSRYFDLTARGVYFLRDATPGARCLLRFRDASRDPLIGPRHAEPFGQR
jgi:hypothetical protein